MEQSQDEIDAIAARILARAPPPFCPRYWAIYARWIAAEESQQEVVLEHLRRHVRSCGCRGYSAALVPEDESWIFADDSEDE